MLNDCVADTAFSLVMDVGREFAAIRPLPAPRHGSRHRSRWPARISGKKLGILGLGRIDDVIAAGMGDLDLWVRAQPLATSRCTWLPRPRWRAWRWSDFLVVAAAGGADTWASSSSRRLAALGPQKPSSTSARGSVIDEDALIRQLENKTIGGAGLDVYADELRAHAALIACDNFVLYPHLASATNAQGRRTRCRRIWRATSAAGGRGRRAVSAAR